MSITAVLNVFKRPHTLVQQLTAIQNQSVPPENIIIWKNFAENITLPEIPENLKKNVTIIESSKNYGAWARFACGLFVTTMYVCVFDDDTIPGRDWFKNCVETMKTHRGLLGTIGLRFRPGNSYSIEPRIGWDGPNENIEQVDIVGHAWFFEQKWTHHLWECHPDYNLMFVAGEDIGFSYILQKYGINTYVPAHPKENKELWGSQHDLAYLYGMETVAISNQAGAYGKFNDALRYYIDKGFVTMRNRKNALSGNMREHLSQVIEKVNKKEHFGLIRPSDGEFLILENKTFNAQAGDDWTNTADGILREHIKNSINKYKDNLFIGIPCNTCGHTPANMYDDYVNKYGVPKSQLTYANIFCNSNWPIFIQFLKSYSGGFCLITTGTRDCDFPIKERYIIDKFLVNNWNDVWQTETNKVLNYINNKQNELICFASGPMTKLWIPLCMELNPNNTYLDIGSALDYFTKGSENARPYTDPNSHYSRECCNFS